MMARWLREKFNLSKDLNFPIVEFIEIILPKLDPSFEFELIDPANMESGIYALTYPDKSYMVIRSDVYENACKGDGRCRFTLAHELFHYLFHDKNNLSLARTTENIPPYMDPEWQANTFAGELLVPFDLVKGMNEYEIQEKCGVSYEVARIQKKYQR